MRIGPGSVVMRQPSRTTVRKPTVNTQEPRGDLGGRGCQVERLRCAVPVEIDAVLRQRHAALAGQVATKSASAGRRIGGVVAEQAARGPCLAHRPRRTSGREEFRDGSSGSMAGAEDRGTGSPPLSAAKLGQPTARRSTKRESTSSKVDSRTCRRPPSMTENVRLIGQDVALRARTRFRTRSVTGAAFGSGTVSPDRGAGCDRKTRPAMERPTPDCRFSTALPTPSFQPTVSVPVERRRPCGPGRRSPGRCVCGPDGQREARSTVRRCARKRPAWDAAGAGSNRLPSWVRPPRSGSRSRSPSGAWVTVRRYNAL